MKRFTKNKRLSLAGVATLIMAGCSTSVSAGLIAPDTEAVASVASVSIPVEEVRKQQMLELSNLAKIESAVKKVKHQVGKTWYVFSGNTPSGWDCSGLVMWAYEQMGIELEHRASKQKHAGLIVKSPKLGDIVAFTYEGGSSAYHVGIYLSEGKMIHSGGGRGDRTSIVSIADFGGDYSKITYTRILDTPEPEAPEVNEAPEVRVLALRIN